MISTFIEKLQIKRFLSRQTSESFNDFGIDGNTQAGVVETGMVAFQKDGFMG